MPSNRILGKTTTSQIHKNHDSKLKLKSKQTERWWFCFLLVHLRRADSSSYSHLLEEKKKTWGHFLCSGSFLLLAASKFNHLLSPPTFALRHPPLSPCNLLHHLHLLMVHASALSPDDAEGEKCSRFEPWWTPEVQLLCITGGAEVCSGPRRLVERVKVLMTPKRARRCFHHQILKRTWSALFSKEGREHEAKR